MFEVESLVYLSDCSNFSATNFEDCSRRKSGFTKIFQNNVKSAVFSCFIKNFFIFRGRGSKYLLRVIGGWFSLSTFSFVIGTTKALL